MDKRLTVSERNCKAYFGLLAVTALRTVNTTSDDVVGRSHA